ncbi:putative disease resistance protein RGA3 [Durio zibethinus]|uniref:Disease resistance protein RGA3 n=1 Tax=Durio zibethinus TaxID=66656 RepID=A0A6P5WQM2_DURZI|nr:putative disease resistance protein RGA3 [Durio zibethinus]
MNDQSVKIWLAELQELAYDVDDVLDEFATEALRRKLQGRDEASSSKMEEITARLNSLALRRSQLELREISGGGRSMNMKSRLQPTSLVDEAHVFGREKQKLEILELLKNSDGGEDGVAVIPIFGMGGVGKTTLAQLVYNDDSISNLFYLKAWVCVSDDFDAIHITKTILQSITSESIDQNDLNLLQVKLKEKLSGKRLLLVLDDIWNENYNDWTILRSPFGVGTKIIVTTRSEKVSSNVVTVEPYPLRQLSYDHCLSIFTHHALGVRDFSGHPQLKEAGENIVRKCNGLPLAAKATGGLLRTVMDQHAWKDISNSEIWDLPNEQCGIMPALRLSYHHLPLHLNRCFAYCSILPKDYEFQEQEIVLLWRAEGFLQQIKPTSPIEGLGNQYFRDLLSRLFFQISSTDKSRFVMHDLVNDLAQSVAGEICSKLEGDKRPQFSERTRHFSYIVDRYDGVKKFETIDKMRFLRTFLPFKLSSEWFNYHLSNTVLADVLSELRCLRVLSLKGYCINELPNHFENLKHLCYLDFSYTVIKRLPDSLCTLCNLEILILKGCKSLEMLPSKIGILVNLQHLDITSANLLKGMPFGIGLENIVKAQDALEAKLTDKSGLDELKLKWSVDFDDATRHKEVEEEVLNFLRPHRGLKELTLKNYGGTRFPTWVVDPSFQNLLSLNLKNCKNCKSLPSIGKLPFLKDLFIGGMDEVMKVGVEFVGENKANAFASLERLCFQDMPKWKEWDLYEADEQIMKFPSLKKLSIINCPQLLGRLPEHLNSLEKLLIRSCTKLVVSVSNLPMLVGLEIDGCAELLFGDYAYFRLLKKVSLSNIFKFCTLMERLVPSLTKVEYLKIDGFKELTHVSQGELGLLRHLRARGVEEEQLQLGKLCNIEFLKISKCERLKRLPQLLHFLKFLREIAIYECPSIVSFSKNNFPPASKTLTINDCVNFQQCLLDEGENICISNTSLLECLAIEGCPSLICLSLPISLQYLVVSNCSKLASLSSSGKLPLGVKKLVIRNLPELESITQAIHENACLECVCIWSCKNVKSLPRGLDKLNHLRKIELASCPNLVSFSESGLPTTELTDLSILGCENFKALPNCMHNLTSLQILVLHRCSAETSFPEEGFPTNLKVLSISSPKICRSLLEWGLHRLTSLKEASIFGEGCLDVVSFPQEEAGMMLPPSITKIFIANFENLKYLSSKGFQNLTSFKNYPFIIALSSHLFWKKTCFSRF